MNKAHETVTVDSVTVLVRGKTQHSPTEVRECARLVAEVLGTICLTGDFTLIACPLNFQGAQHLYGLSVKGIANNAIVFGYQPGGNGTRMKYIIHHNRNSLNDFFESLKAVIGTSYHGHEKPKLVQPMLPAVEELVTRVQNPSPLTSPGKPIAKPEIYYTSDPEWMEMFILYLVELSDESGGKVTKDQVYDLIISHTHYTSRYGLGVIYSLLERRGHLVEVEGVVDVFTVVGAPVPLALKERPVPKPKAPKLAETKSSASPKRNSYLRDEEWVRTCVSSLQQLVKNRGGKIPQAELRSFIAKQAKRPNVNGSILSICKGLESRGKIIRLSAGNAREVLYQVVYTPAADVVEKAVAAIEHSRAETAKVFDGFAKFKLPDFAEGMFANKRILDDFLTIVGKGEVSTAILQGYIEQEFKGTYRTAIYKLFDYLVGQGYLLRPKRGTYKLGPLGRERLGLPQVKFTTKVPEATSLALPSNSAPLHNGALSEEVASSNLSPAKTVEAVASDEQAQLASFLAAPTKSESSSLAGGASYQVTIALAKLAKQDLQLTPEVEAAQRRVAALRRRKADAQAKIAEQPDIQALVQKRLLEEIMRD